jgi:hypothetical protein
MLFEKIDNPVLPQKWSIMHITKITFPPFHVRGKKYRQNRELKNCNLQLYVIVMRRSKEGNPICR